MLSSEWMILLLVHAYLGGGFYHIHFLLENHGKKMITDHELEGNEQQLQEI